MVMQLVKDSQNSFCPNIFSALLNNSAVVQRRFTITGSTFSTLEASLLQSVSGAPNGLESELLVSIKLTVFMSACSRLKAQKSKLKATHFPPWGPKEECSGVHSDKLYNFYQWGLTSFPWGKVPTLSPRDSPPLKNINVWMWKVQVMIWALLTPVMP